jgi:hypothetical protein
MRRGHIRDADASGIETGWARVTDLQASKGRMKGRRPAEGGHLDPRSWRFLGVLSSPPKPCRARLYR